MIISVQSLGPGFASAVCIALLLNQPVTASDLSADAALPNVDRAPALTFAHRRKPRSKKLSAGRILARYKQEPSPSSAAFFEDFSGNTGLQKFDRGVYHRNAGSQQLGKAAVITAQGGEAPPHGGKWTGDHDHNCGSPATQRPLSSTLEDFNIDEVIYACRDHVMTSMGHVDAYSIVWFSPNELFSGGTHKSVSWDVNVTYLGNGQWWEVLIVPLGASYLASFDWQAPTAQIDEYDKGAIVVGNGPYGRSVNITTNRQNRFNGWQHICKEQQYSLDPKGCRSKKIRRRFSITDNNNGTLTVKYGGMFTQTIAGKFPSRFKVYFTDHNYEPDADGPASGYTWHWDNIRIQ